MKVLNPKLMHYARSAKFFIILVAVLGILQAALTITQSFLIAGTISPIIAENHTFNDVLPLFLDLLGVFLARGAVMWVSAAQSHKSAQKTIQELRELILRKALALGPRYLSRKGTDVATLTTRGLTDLDPYFRDYLPQLLLAVTVTPAALITMVVLDFWSALVALIALPLIPVFMVLIGRITEEVAGRRFSTMQALGRQLLDLIGGLPTLKALGRQRAPEKQVKRIGSTWAKSTMATLKLAFLSGAVLEFISILAVAMVAVEVGTRLVYGNIDLFTGLTAIMLAPEVFAPVREVGKHFHASSNGIAAFNAALKIIEAEPLPDGNQEVPKTFTGVKIRDLSIRSRSGLTPSSLSANIEPGTLNVLIGPSGSGKTTTVLTLLKFLTPDSGSIEISGLDISQVRASSWWRQVSWVPQSPLILPGSVLENLDVEQADERVLAAAAATGFDRVVASLPAGWDSLIGQGGAGLSLGQRQRLALTKAMLTDRQVIILDEPTAHLDAALEAQVNAAVQTIKESGRTVIAIAHRAGLTKIADQIIEVRAEIDPQQADTHTEVEGARAQLAELPVLLGPVEGEVIYR